jgi:hypothetical protein
MTDSQTKHHKYFMTAKSIKNCNNFRLVKNATICQIFLKRKICAVIYDSTHQESKTEIEKILDL